MKNYLKLIVDQVKRVTGNFWSFIPALLGQLKTALSEGDEAKMLEIADRLEATAREEREHADSLDKLAAEVRAAVADHAISGTEYAEIAEGVQTALDEGEDVVTGQDEDDPKPV